MSSSLRPSLTAALLTNESWKKDAELAPNYGVLLAPRLAPHVGSPRSKTEAARSFDSARRPNQKQENNYKKALASKAQTLHLVQETIASTHDLWLIECEDRQNDVILGTSCKRVGDYEFQLCALLYSWINIHTIRGNLKCTKGFPDARFLAK
jgi:hypothetical protein